jgi:hypothetical protein
MGNVCNHGTEEANSEIVTGTGIYSFKTSVIIYYE